LIVPDFKAVERYLKDNHVPYIARSTMLDIPEVYELLNHEISDYVSTKNGFKSFEHIFRFAILEKPFEIGKELSAKQEVKRHVIAKQFKKQIDQLFK
jgi:long-chain acyl-CoA synthetase